MKKRIIAVALLMIMLFSFASCGTTTRESNFGFSIDLPFHYTNTQDFLAKVIPEFDSPTNVCTYSSMIEGISVTAIKNFDPNDGSYDDLRDHPAYQGMSDFEIAYALAEEDVANSSQELTLEVINGVPAVEQKIIDQVSGLSFYYVVDGCSVQVVFVCNSDKYDKLKEKIISYADTIEVK